MWIFSDRVDIAYDNGFVPFLGLLFLPWTALIYTFAYAPFGGVSGLGWVFVTLGLVADLASYGAGEGGRRSARPGPDRFPRRLLGAEDLGGADPRDPSGGHQGDGDGHEHRQHQADRHARRDDHVAGDAGARRDLPHTRRAVAHPSGSPTTSPMAAIVPRRGQHGGRGLAGSGAQGAEHGEVAPPQAGGDGEGVDEGEGAEQGEEPAEELGQDAEVVEVAAPGWGRRAPRARGRKPSSATRASRSASSATRT